MWEEPFATAIRTTKRKTEFTLCQKQDVIKVIQRKDQDRRFIKRLCSKQMH